MGIALLSILFSFAEERRGRGSAKEKGSRLCRHSPFNSAGFKESGSTSVGKD